MKVIIINIKISKETALTLWHKNLNLTKDLYGTVNRALALQLTHNDIEAIKAQALTKQGTLSKRLRVAK